MGGYRRNQGEGAQRMPGRADDLLRDPRWKRVRMLAFKRDKAKGAACWVCGGRIDYDAPMSSYRDAYEADHRKPRSKFPELAFELSNIKPSHVKCNRSRKDGAVMNALGEPSRKWRS